MSKNKKSNILTTVPKVNNTITNEEYNNKVNNLKVDLNKRHANLISLASVYNDAYTNYLFNPYFVKDEEKETDKFINLSDLLNSVTQENINSNYNKIFKNDPIHKNISVLKYNFENVYFNCPIDKNIKHNSEELKVIIIEFIMNVFKIYHWKVGGLKLEDPNWKINTIDSNYYEIDNNTIYFDNTARTKEDYYIEVPYLDRLVDIINKSCQEYVIASHTIFTDQLTDRVNVVIEAIITE